MNDGFIIERNRLDGITAFLRVAERRNFRAAASDLGISPSAIGQVIRSLEARLGVALFVRTTRRVSLTDAGHRLYAEASPAIAALDEAFHATRLMGDQVTGLLRLNVLQAVGGFLLEPIVEEFCREHPEVEVEIFTTDRNADIVGEGFDAGMRLGDHVEEDMIALRMTPPFDFVIAGAPGYFAEHGRPRRPEELGQHRCIRYRLAKDTSMRWSFVDGTRNYTLAVKGRLILNQVDLMIAAAEKGFGLIQVARPLIDQQLGDGSLVTVLDDFAPKTPGLFLYYPSRSHALPKLRAFNAFVARRKWWIPSPPVCG